MSCVEVRLLLHISVLSVAASFGLDDASEVEETRGETHKKIVDWIIERILYQKALASQSLLLPYYRPLFPYS